MQGPGYGMYISVGFYANGKTQGRFKVEESAQDPLKCTSLTNLRARVDDPLAADPQIHTEQRHLGTGRLNSTSKWCTEEQHGQRLL